jgi:arylsulfatase A-like enzyme
MRYATNYYTSRAVDLIEGHGEKKRLYEEEKRRLRRPSSPSSSPSPLSPPSPFMMYFAIQNVHSPYTLPPAWEVKEFPQMWDKTYANMLALLDSATANLTLALHRSGLWDDTLILWTSDNGGIGRGNNHGLRGHKHDPWEGGTRATAFLSGGFLPPAVRGQSTGPKLVHISDWYPTFAGGEEDKKACCAAVLLCCCAAVCSCA